MAGLKAYPDNEIIQGVLPNMEDREEAKAKAWAMSVAENVAKAAKEGGFLGFGGEQVSAGEKTLFAELASTLGAESPSIS